MVSGYWIAWLGDYYCQSEIEIKTYDSLRGAVVASYGGIEILIEAFLFLPLLDFAFGRKVNKLGAFKKVFCEQMLYTPGETGIFIKWTNYFESQPESFEDKMSRDYFLTLFSSWFFWVPVSFINYYFVPTQYRALYIVGTTLVIDVMMSYATHNNLKESYERLLGRKIRGFVRIET